jgi:hypothetical protein
MPQATEPSKATHLFGPEHHQHVEKALRRLREEVFTGDPRQLCEYWRQFESELLQHLRDEEQYILPRFADENPAEAHVILADHAEIRRLLSELGVSVDLHLLRAPIADQLLARLHEHARREDSCMYPWAASHLA